MNSILTHATSQVRLGASFGAGVLVALAMPPLPLGFLAPVGIAIWLWALSDCATPFRSGVLFGVGFCTLTLFWIGWVTVPGTVALILISAAEYGLLAATYRRLIQRRSEWAALLFFPALWVLLEKLRATGFIGFPWLNVAHTQLDYLWLYQFVEFTGDYGLSLWVVSAGALLYSVISHRRTFHVVATAAWIAVPLLWGVWRIDHLPPATRTANVAILQGDIDTYRKWDESYVDTSFAVYDSLTRQAAPGADLIIWPETAAPTYLYQFRTHRLWAEAVSAAAGKPLLMGTLSFRRAPERDYIYNSAYLVHPDGQWEGPYSKRHLVPFGEMIPGAQWFPWLATIDLGQGNFELGPGPVVFDSAGWPHSVLICYESMFSELARDQVLRGARFLVIITNDSWYGRTPGPAQHAAVASLRAAEFRMGVARAANGGISLWTDRAGRRRNETKLFERTIVRGEVPLGEGPTFYARIGPWPVWLATLWSVVAIVIAWRPRRR